MDPKAKSVIAYELYSARFRRNFNSINKMLNNPRSTLKRVVVVSRRAHQPIFVAISAQTYTEEISYLKRFTEF